MTTYNAVSPETLRALQLGDIVSLQSGIALSVRAVERQLAENVGTMAGFVLLGELGPDCVLLAIPSGKQDSVDIYSPLDHVPAHAKAAQVACQGVISYWAPHLPNLSGALGELGYKVASLRGSVDPMVLIWRGKERVVFVRTSTLAYELLNVTELPRNLTQTEVDQVRYAATVHQHAQPVHTEPRKLPQEISTPRKLFRRR